MPLHSGVTESLSDFSINSLSKRYMSLEVSPEFDGYSGVEIVVDKNTTYFAGSTTGRVLTIENEWGTQEQAENILKTLQGYRYQPYTATGALLNPAAELGDGVSLNGLYSGIFSISRDYGRLMATDIEAPADEEIDHEYPYESSSTRSIDRQFSAVESKFTIQSNEIAAKVSETGGDEDSFSWSLVKDSFVLKSKNSEVFRVDKDGAKVSGVITATSGNIGKFSIGDKAIYNNISDFANSGDKSQGVYLGTDGIRLGKNFSVDTSGNVSANNMTLTGTLNVGGNQITATALQSGAQSAYSNGGYWSGGASGGYNFINATDQYGSTYRASYFRTSYLDCSGTVSTQDLSVSRYFTFGIRNLSLIAKADASYVLGY